MSLKIKIKSNTNTDKHTQQRKQGEVRSIQIGQSILME
jgi:hypothetical protein